MKLNQSGLKLVEVLLIILIIGVFGFGGYYVLSNDSEETPKTEETAAVIEQKEEQPTETTTTVEEDTKPAENVKEAGYLYIDEYNVRMKLSDAALISYQIDKTAVQVFDEQAIATISPAFGPGLVTDPTCDPGLSLYVADVEPQTFTNVKIGDLYYFVTGAPGVCENDADTVVKTRFVEEFNTANLSAVE